MKRIFAILLCISMIMTFGACGANTEGTEETKLSGHKEETSEQGYEETAGILDTGKKAPSEELIMQDLCNALEDKIGSAEVTKVETVKSLTEESSFYIVMTTDVASKYADWVFEVKMYYTKYDQGWMLDHVEWVSEEFLLVRAPSREEMVELAKGYLSNHESERLRALADIQGGEVILIAPPDAKPNTRPTTEEMLKSGTVIFEWECESYHNDQGYVDAIYRSKWIYSNGTWVLMEDSDSKIEEIYSVTRINVDISGSWPLLNGNTVTISDFTGKSFTANWDGNDIVFQRQEAPQLKTQSRYFTDASENYRIDFSLSKSGGSSIAMIVIYQASGNTIRELARGTISGDLPKLG